VGRLAPGIEVRIIPVSDEAIADIASVPALPTRQPGEIIVKGPCVTRAYDETSERAKDANAKSKIKDGDTVWHRMGDVGYLDDAGRLWFCGRKAHRVETAAGPLFSVPVEAVAETVWPARAALVWRGASSPQEPVVLLEHPVKAAAAKGRKLAVGEVPPTSTVTQVLAEVLGLGDIEVRVWPTVFPVDRRHNAKIEREALARQIA
jgi:acyl-CoA synthetase (AMP-forming)/AMP-acid ligase II